MERQLKEELDRECHRTANLFARMALALRQPPGLWELLAGSLSGRADWEAAGAIPSAPRLEEITERLCFAGLAFAAAGAPRPVRHRLWTLFQQVQEYHQEVVEFPAVRRASLLRKRRLSHGRARTEIDRSLARVPADAPEPPGYTDRLGEFCSEMDHLRQQVLPSRSGSVLSRLKWRLRLARLALRYNSACCELRKASAATLEEEARLEDEANRISDEFVRMARRKDRDEKEGLVLAQQAGEITLRALQIRQAFNDDRSRILFLLECETDP